MANRESRWTKASSLITRTFLLIIFILGLVAQFVPKVADALQGATFVGGAVLTLVGYLLYSTLRGFVADREDPAQAESRARVREAEEGLEEALRGSAAGDTTTTDNDQARLTLPELWAVTHRRLDHYHGIALRQAKQSFRNAQIAMGLGFTLLVAFVIIALNAATAAGSLVAGGLGAVSAGLAGYVSRTFIRSQEAAAVHLRAYFDQPLAFSRYLAAERLMADAGLSDEKHAEILSTLVQAMVSGTAGPVPASTTEGQPPTPP
ncbi:TRADD-N-associated membrane domain-containing protein [Streptomyces griseorubiginosus]|uniref:TRADD-N-associated membrane domain-containing protein n=1 Tax=Streptomyces griseorubiginosus TaxID=67304 RepID=UPI00113FD022|nr:hypothetical protein [Streptomyces griseorubiginosus]